MTDTTFDSRRRCPKCNELGKITGKTVNRDGSTMYSVVCQNKDRCRWYNGAPYIFQQRRDGTLVEAQEHDKFFPSIPDRTSEVQGRIDEDLARQQYRR